MSAEMKTVALSAGAYQTLKQAIIRCDLAPGAHVTESQLVERFDLSRAPVRAALQRLCQEGLMQAVARSGHVIQPITLTSVHSIFDVRLLLEPAAVERAAERSVSTRVLEQLDQLCADARYDPSDKIAISRFLASNTRFHIALVSGAGNHFLTEMVGRVLEQMERFFHLALHLRDRNDEMYHEHHELIDAVARRDSKMARRVAEEQLLSARQMVIDSLMTHPSIQGVNLDLGEPNSAKAK